MPVIPTVNESAPLVDRSKTSWTWAVIRQPPSGRYAAVGIETVIEVSVSESPVSMVTGADSGALNSNVPDEDADQNDRSVTDSPLLPAHDVHSGSFDALIVPPEATAQVTDSRVTVLDVFAVPAGPGSPVFSPI